MVDDLLDVSRINTGKVELRCASVELSDIIRDAVAACEPQNEAARHTLTVSIPDAPLHLHADAARLVQVLMNLLSNAAKFTAPEGRLSVSAARDGGHAVVHVRDNGPGIAAESLPHIFDMFSQVEDAHRCAGGGLGLGLSIVRNLVELHGGSVQAVSAGAGQGAEFIVRLPLAEARAPAPAAETDNAPTNGAARACRVLVVDDNHDAARTLSMMLEKVGFDCRSSFDGPSALTAAGEFDPHAIVLDIGMPGMDGLEVARRLRAQPDTRDTLLIALTGWDKEEDRSRSRAAGFDHHLAKPVQLSVLQQLLDGAGRSARASGGTVIRFGVDATVSERAVARTQ